MPSDRAQQCIIASRNHQMRPAGGRAGLCDLSTVATAGEVCSLAAAHAAFISAQLAAGDATACGSGTCHRFEVANKGSPLSRAAEGASWLVNATVNSVA